MLSGSSFHGYQTFGEKLNKTDQSSSCSRKDQESEYMLSTITITASFLSTLLQSLLPGWNYSCFSGNNLHALCSWTRSLGCFYPNNWLSSLKKKKRNTAQSRWIGSSERLHRLFCARLPGQREKKKEETHFHCLMLFWPIVLKLLVSQILVSGFIQCRHHLLTAAHCFHKHICWFETLLICYLVK